MNVSHKLDADKPNILLISLDCLRWDSVSINNPAARETAAIDSIGLMGTNFTCAFTNGGWTQPGISSLLTSTYGLMYDGCRNALSEHRPSLAKILSDAGYNTVGFSTNPQVGTHFAYDTGFRHFYDLPPHRVSPKWHQTAGVRKLLRSDLAQAVLHHFADTRPAAQVCDAEYATDNVLEWLARKGNEPFFAWIHFTDPHFPYHIDDNLQNPAQRALAWRQLKSLYASAATEYSLHPGQEVLDQMISDYADAVCHVDQQVGRLLNTLRKEGILDNTMVIVTADHGEEFFEHGHWSHLRLYDEVIHVPLLICGPNVTRKRISEALVSHIDIAPTILEHIGLNPDQHMHGRPVSLKAIGEDTPINQNVISEMVMGEGSHFVSIRTDSHKLIHWQKEPDRPELYDLLEDPTERMNIAEAQKEIAAQLRLIALEHLEQVADGRANHTVSDKAAVPDEISARLIALGYLD